MSPSSRRSAPRRPRVGVVKFASCDGCQLSVLDLEDDLLAIAERFDIVEFPEATSRRSSGPFDVLLVEGSISTDEQLEELLRLRRETTTLVTIGACATAGGIQAIRNWSDLGPWAATVYPQPIHWRWRRPSPTTWSWTPSCGAARSTPASCSSS